MIIEELSDGRFVGLLTSEIMSFPVPAQSTDDSQLRQLALSFANTLSEFHRIAIGTIAMAEMTWITEAVEQQAFLSRIRIFLTVRTIAASQSEAESWLKQLMKSLQFSLETQHFRLQVDCDKEMQALMNSLDTQCTVALTKEMRITGSTAISLPYAYCKPFVISPNDNFESFIQALSQSRSCLVSIQVFPIMLTSNEQTYFTAASSEISMIINESQTRGIWVDSTLSEAANALSQMNQSINRLLLFHLVLQGDLNSCLALEAKMHSMLSAEDGSNLVPYDLSSDSIRLADSMLLYPWNISNRLIYSYQLNGINSVGFPAVCVRMPNLVSPAEMAVFFRLPIRTDYMAALRESDKETGSEQFDAALLNSENIQIGALLNRPDINIYFPAKLFTKHMLIVGMPGSGKTTFCVNMLLQFARKGIPFLAIEPTKAEYRAMIDILPEMQIFTPGNNMVSPFIINPFIPPKGVSVEKYIPSLFSAFHAAFSMPSPLDVIFLKAIRQCYMRYGWKDYSCAGDNDVTPFGIYEFILEFRQIVENANYAKDIKGNLQSAGTFRLMNLIEQNSNIYDTVNTIPLEDLLRSPTVLELNAIDDSQQKALLMSLMLISICAYTKHNHAGDGKLKNILLLDEAHVLLAPGSQTSDAQSEAITRLQNMIVEIRSYGTAIFIADQSPSRVTREVVANTDIKVSFRLVQGIDRELIADSCNMSERASLELSKLKPGQAYTYCSLLQPPQLIATPDIREEDSIRLSVPDREIADRMNYWQTHQPLLRPFKLCQQCSECNFDCDLELRARADFYAGKMMFQYASSIHDIQTLQRYLLSMRKILGKHLDGYSSEKQSRLIHCTQIRFYRKIRMSEGLFLSDENLKKIIQHSL